MKTTEVKGTPVSPRCDVKPSASWDRAYAGELLPVTFDVQWPADAAQIVRIENLSTTDPDIQLDVDMLQHGIELRPGEHYRFQVPIRVARSKSVDLSAIELSYTPKGEGEDRKDVVTLRQPLDKRILQVKPSLGREIRVKLEPLCKYEQGTKVLLTLKHEGVTRFTDFQMDLGPVSAIAAGKPRIQRPVFAPGDREAVELVVNDDKLDVVLVASSNGLRPELHETHKVVPTVATGEKRFRFLEPRRLTKDRIRIVQVISEKEKPAVKQQNATYVLDSGCQYEISIQTMQPGVSGVRLNAMAPVLQVRKEERRGEDWVFTVDVTVQQMFRYAERLFYEMDTANGKLSGEIPICLRRTPFFYLGDAAKYGAAPTLQGGYALVRLLRQLGESLSGSGGPVNVAEHAQMLLLLSIPAAWLGLWWFDWLQYQFKK